jgi:amidase
MTRTVRDLALMLGALTGVDPRDDATKPSAGKSYTDYARFLSEGGLRGARIGVVRETFMGYSPKTDKLVEQAIDVIKHSGATVVDPANMPSIAKIGDAELEVLLYELKTDLNAYLDSLGPGAPYKTLADIIRFNEEHASTEMPYFGQELFEQAQKKGPLTDTKYKAARAKCIRLARTDGIDAVMSQHRLDVLIAPTQGPVWLIDLVNGDGGGGGSFTQPAAIAGYPHITVPMGLVQGLPVGLSFVGRAWSEPTLLKLAYAYEQASKARKAPTFAATAIA